MAHEDPSVRTAGEGDAGQPIAGNRLHVLVPGAERLTALLALVEGARERLDLFYYIFAPDEVGSTLLDALIEARNRGVEVRLMIDAFGSSGTADAFFAPLRAAGGQMLWFGAGWSTRYLIRNHQKMAIADGTHALIGGFNVADDYFKAEAQDGWHDLGLKINGPAVTALAQWYACLWDWTSAPDRNYLRLRRMVARWSGGSGPFRWLVGGPTSHLSPWAHMVMRDLDGARRVDMVAAYFSPGNGLLRRLRRVAGCGPGADAGDGVRLVLAARSDNTTTIAASRLLYGPLVRRGVRIYEYLPARLHMKLIVIDDAVYIGSANFDLRSLFINLELMLRIEDAEFAQAMRALVAIQAERSEHVTPQLLKQRRHPLRLLKGWLSYFLVSVVDYTVTRRLNFSSDDQV